VRVFTEEVRLPVVATDAGGHYDAALEADEVLVLEDGEPQQIRSVRHIPGNVLMILDTGGGDNSGLAGLSKKNKHNARSRFADSLSVGERRSDCCAPIV
jgi:hypothetical protein